MTFDDFLQFLHVASAFGFVGGLLGRDIVLGQARRSQDISKVEALVEVAGPLERYLVIPGSIAVLLFGILVWWAQGIPVWSEGTRWVTVSLVLYATTIPLVPLIFLPRGKVFEAALTSAIAAGHVTPELSAAFWDPFVTGARWYELGVVAVVILLMVTKPF